MQRLLVRHLLALAGLILVAAPAAAQIDGAGTGSGYDPDMEDRTSRTKDREP